MMLPMTTRIPSSLKWLVDKYQSYSRQLEEIDGLIAKYNAQKILLQDSVASLSKVLSMHEIPVSAQDIPSRKVYKRACLPYGKITKLIYKCYSSLPDGEDASLSEIMHFIALGSSWEDFSTEGIRYLRRCVRNRLKNMVHQGKLCQTRIGSCSAEPRYALNE